MKKIKIVIGVFSLIGLLGLAGCSQPTTPSNNSNTESGTGGNTENGSGGNTEGETQTEDEKLQARITEFNTNFSKDINNRDVVVPFENGKYKVTSVIDSSIVIKLNDTSASKLSDTRNPVEDQFTLQQIEITYKFKHVSENNPQYALVDISQKHTLTNSQGSKILEFKKTPYVIVHKADEFILYNGFFYPTIIFTNKTQIDNYKEYMPIPEIIKYGLENIFKYYNYYNWEVETTSAEPKVSKFKQLNLCNYDGTKVTIGDVTANMDIKVEANGPIAIFSDSKDSKIIKDGTYSIDSKVFENSYDSNSIVLAYGTPVYILRLRDTDTPFKIVVAAKDRLVDVSTDILIEKE